MTVIRYFCSVTAVENPGKDCFADIAFDYFVALRDSGFSVRVLPMGKVDLTDSSSRWYEHSYSFATPISKNYINVVCGDNGDLVKYFTVGVKNVAITAILKNPPTENETKALGQYDAVICPTEQDAGSLRHLGVLAMYVRPEADALSRLLRGFI